MAKKHPSREKHKKIREQTASESSRHSFVAEHRGGPLSERQHRKLIHWAYDCIMHVLQQVELKEDARLEHALEVAKSWEAGKASVGEARTAAKAVIDFANELKDPASIAIVRGIGHVVSTAHMADHSPGAAEYALKALSCKGISYDDERKWQDHKLPSEIKKLVLESRKEKSEFWDKHLQKAWNSSKT